MNDDFDEDGFFEDYGDTDEVDLHTILEREYIPEKNEWDDY